MKYLIYTLLMLCGYGLTFGLFPLVLPYWLAIDVTLILIVCISQSTKDYTGGIIGLITGLVVDIFISTAFGLYALIYGAIGYLYSKFSSRSGTDSFLSAMLVVVLCYILKDIVLMGYGLIYGTKFAYFDMLLKMTLPSAIVNGLLCFALYFGVFKLHELRALKARRELDFLRNYKEQTDWLSSWFEQYK